MSGKSIVLVLLAMLMYVGYRALRPHYSLGATGAMRTAGTIGLFSGICLFVCMLVVGAAHAETIPHEAARYQRDVIRHAHAVWGLDAPVATFAAQIHTESRWRANATSPVGARGLAQFMPGTERWIAGAYAKDLGAGGATNPAWAIRALVTYDRYLYDRITAVNACERLAMALSAYNGGLGWIYRDQQKASGKGPGQPDLHLQWFGGVERFNSGRSAAAFAENRAYPRLILQVREPLYIAAGWGRGACQ